MSVGQVFDECEMECKVLFMLGVIMDDQISGYLKVSLSQEKTC